LQKQNINLQEYIQFLNSLDIPIAQYRNKEKLGNLKDDLKLIKSNFNGKVIVNDYIDFIDFADGLHIGQEDLQKINSNPLLAIAKIREKIGSKILGLSTHNIAEIKEANSLEIDYIGLGAYRSTNTKEVNSIGGKELLEIAKISKHKVALIGGVMLKDNFENNPQITYKVIGSNLVNKFLQSNNSTK